MSSTAQQRFTIIEALEPKANGKEAHPTGKEALPKANEPKSPVEAKKDWRDADGRFLRGNHEATGNPFAREVAEAKAAFLKVGSPEVVEKLAGVILGKAMEGNMVAAKLFLEYTLGKPSKAVDPDRLEVGEFEYFRETAGKYGWAAKNLIEPEAEFTLKTLRAVRSGVSVDLGKRLSQGIKDIDSGKRKMGDPLPPIANGEMRVVAPSANGSGGAEAPSANGSGGAEAPSANGSGGGPGNGR